jgi:nucleoside-diphosphate-sugar epimerase
MNRDFILVTGANGFVGQSLCTTLFNLNFKVLAAVRPHKGTLKDIKSIEIDELDSKTVWRNALIECSHIIHLAARVHVMHDDVANALELYRKVNVEGTLNLAMQAAAAGVKRFIFISSIKVNGESTLLGAPFCADNSPNPRDPYGISKLEAEEGLKKIAFQTGMEIVIIRSPLVYGPRVKANFFSMMSWLRRGIPLPLGGVTKNRRSFIFVDNLVDLIVTCINHPAAANQLFLVSDDEDLSTAGLLKRMASALRQPLRLIFVPSSFIMLGAWLIGKPDIARRLCGSLQVDIKKTKDLLGWSPPVSVEEGLHRTASSFLGG